MEINYKIQNKKIFIMLILITVTVVFVIGAVLVPKGYAVKLDGETIGIVEDENHAKQALEEAKIDIEQSLESEIVIPHEITIEAAKNIDPKDTKTTEEIKESIKENIDINIQAFGINVDGQDLVYLNSQEDVQEVLSRLKEKYNEDKKEYKEVNFVEEIKTSKKPLPINEVQDIEDALEYILIGTDEEKTYIFEDGDTVWDIMVEYDLTEEEIEKANPDINLERIQIGQELTLTVPKQLITVETIEAVSYKEDIPYETQYEGSKDMYEGDKKVKKEGKDGQKKVYANIIRENGIEKEEEVIEEEILEEAQKEIVVRGTKERPKTVATGNFSTPARGRISSNFGQRWGRKHEGIDIALPTGTPIKAADGGRVTFAGSRGAYGKLVIINHENGLETRYAHNSSLSVKSGERVYKGQTIAKSGNTGRSTGPHLHFEVRKNGRAINPREYVNF